MKPQAVDSISFGYSSILKTYYKRGKLPIKYGFYGDVLTPKNVTLEHLRCISDGGHTELKNLVLASANKNQERGCKPLSEMLNWKYAGRYLEQFRNIKIDSFDGNKYIDMILNTIRELI